MITERGSRMKRTTRLLPTFIVAMLMLILMTACGQNKNAAATSDEALRVCGSWAYIHDKETAIAVFHEDGTAQYEGKDYSFECNSQFIKLTNSDGETIQLRYALDDEGMYLYSNNTYTFSGEGEPNGLVGEWSCAEKNWSYSFSEDGTFLEDGFFPGNYTVDDDNSTFKLVYNDQFEDTVCYFQLEENKLSIEYPWRMVKITDK
jgi:major membrane immunogen (membrane-anchored lipoprotein)